MSDSVLLGLAVVLLADALIGVWLIVSRKRRVRVADDPEARKREAARRAIEKMSKESRGRKGTIRGEGGGGDDRTAQDAGYGTDFGGGI